MASKKEKITEATVPSVAALALRTGTNAMRDTGDAKQVVRGKQDTADGEPASLRTQESMVLARVRQLQPKNVALPKGIGTGSRNSLRFGRIKLFSIGTVAVNGSVNKYIQAMAGLTDLTWNQIVANSRELSSLLTLYSEGFVKSITLRYVPVNSNSNNSSGNGVLATAAGAPGFVNTLMGVLCFRLHSSPAVSDSVNAPADMMASSTHKLVDMASPWVFTGRNPEKFSWTGTLGDSTTSTSTMAWLTLSALSAGVVLGGSFQISTPEPSGAAAGIGTLVELGVFGHIVMEVDMCVRNRF